MRDYRPSTVLNAGQNHYIAGGSDRYMFSLAELLGQHGHPVVPFAAAHARNLPTPWARYFPPAVNFVRPGLRDIARYVYSPAAAGCLRRLLHDTRVDIAHLHIYYGQLTGAILAPLLEAGIPIVQTLHEYKLVCPTYSLYAHGAACQRCEGHAYWRAIATRCNRGSLARSALSALEAYVSDWAGARDKVSHFLAVSDFLRNKVIELGVPADKVTRLHNFIDCSGYRCSDQPGDYLLYFGRLERNKGLYTLLDAVAPLRETRLLIAGDGSEREALAAEVARRGLDHVQLLGFQQGDALHRLIEGSVCSVAPSEWYETFGLTLLESFAHGRPVVASGIGGMTEVVREGSDGLLFAPGNVDALREKLLWMWTHRSEAVAMGRHGRAKAEADFTPQRHYEQLMAVYRKLGVRNAGSA